MTDGGELDRSPGGGYDLTTLIVTMEALLIEGLEPPQNRKRGDGFNAVEFLQVEDPDLQRAQAIRLVTEALKGHLWPMGVWRRDWPRHPRVLLARRVSAGGRVGRS